MLCDNLETIQSKVIILTDVLSVLEALSNSQNKELNALTSTLSSLQQFTEQAV